MGLVGGNIMAYIPTADEWKQICKSDVWMERWGHQPLLQGPPPPVCLVARESVGEGEDMTAAVNRLGYSMIAEADSAILALRLFKEGWFLDPWLSEIIFSQGMFNIRYVGPYRQAFMTRPQEDFIPNEGTYRLEIHELSVREDEHSPVKPYWDLVHNYHAANHTSGDIAIENFHRSYDWHTYAAVRAAFLFTAVDAMLGGMSARDIGEMKMETGFHDRFKAAMQVPLLGVSPSDAQREADWIDTSGRRMRNEIAHGRTSEAESAAKAGLERLRRDARVLLRQYLAFSIRWEKDHDRIQTRLRLPAKCSPAGAYNVALEYIARGFDDVFEFLRW